MLHYTYRRYDVYMDKEGVTLATEILKEIKASARRWFIAFLVMCGIEICTISGFLWYISLPVEETVTVENDDGNASYIGNSNTITDSSITGVNADGKNHSEKAAGGQTAQEITAETE